MTLFWKWCWPWGGEARGHDNAAKAISFTSAHLEKWAVFWAILLGNELCGSPRNWEPGEKGADLVRGNNHWALPFWGTAGVHCCPRQVYLLLYWTLCSALQGSCS